MSLLKKVTRGKIQKPYGIVIYGPGGVGKSTFASQAPNPIFLGPEQGTNNLDVARFPKIESWADTRAAVRELINDEHDFKTLIVDSLDWVEPLLYEEICRRYGTKTMELAAGGYGKAYKEATVEWSDFIKDLDRLRERGVNVILIAHCKITEFHDPQIQVPVDRYGLKLRDTESAKFEEWCDAMLFATFQTVSKKADHGDYMQAFTTGNRVLHVERSATHDAKNRYGLRQPIELSWQAFVDAVAASNAATPEAVIARINGLLTQLNDAEQKAKIASYVETVKTDLPKLLGVEQKVLTFVGKGNNQ